jgi:Holliday junction resolvase RusA-like endonuclease
MRQRFIIEGEPVPDQRPRARVMGKIASLYTAPRHRKRMDEVAIQVATQIAWDMPDLTLPFALVVTTCPGTTKAGRPRKLRGDHDNYAKLIADACQSLLYENDRQGVLIAGCEGQPVEGMGLQIIDIVWLEPEEEPAAAIEDSILALLTSLEHRDR